MEFVAIQDDSMENIFINGSIFTTCWRRSAQRLTGWSCEACTKVLRSGVCGHSQREDHRMQRDSLQEILDKAQRPEDTKSSSHPTLCLSLMQVLHHGLGASFIARVL